MSCARPWVTLFSLSYLWFQLRNAFENLLKVLDFLLGATRSLMCRLCLSVRPWTGVTNGLVIFEGAC